MLEVTHSFTIERVQLFNALSASRIRSSRACWRVERDSLMRSTAFLSGSILKFPIVWWMSCLLLGNALEESFVDLLLRDLRRESF